MNVVKNSTGSGQTAFDDYVNDALAAGAGGRGLEPLGPAPWDLPGYKPSWAPGQGVSTTQGVATPVTASDLATIDALERGAGGQNPRR